MSWTRRRAGSRAEKPSNCSVGFFSIDRFIIPGPSMKRSVTHKKVHSNWNPKNDEKDPNQNTHQNPTRTLMRTRIYIFISIV